jgi:mono/diheme cytochrome c family protein
MVSVKVAAPLACVIGIAVAPPTVFSADSASAVERGRYLVEEVAKCGDCHTPFNEKGEPDRSNWLKGATLNFAPIHPVEGWHKVAPDLTSSGRLFQRWGEKGLVTFMMTGKGPSSHAADPPMPTYHLKQDDAEAVVAYLKSLK